MEGRFSWCLAREILQDDIVMAGPNPFNSQSRVLKIDRTISMMLSQRMTNIFCVGSP
jgi:hypothetical protein